MIRERFFTPGLAQVAYGVGDAAAGVAAIIDPRRDIADYIAWASANDLVITAVLETHVHADFVSGAPELAAATGAVMHLSQRGEQAFPHQPLDDGDVVSVGAIRLQALWTPGHTPEHLAFLLFPSDEMIDPVALYSGDALFVGEVGRPDLLGDGATRQLAEALFTTVTRRLAELPDDVVVYPGHTAGSACGRQIGDAPTTTIGQEKMGNYAFQFRERDAFVAGVLAGMPTPPTYYPIVKNINKQGAPLLATLPDPAPLDADAVRQRQTTGALVVDTRSAEDFAVGHVPGAYFCGLGSNFTTWMGWKAPYDTELILVLDDDAERSQALLELRRIGVDHVVGHLVGGMSAWRGAGLTTKRLETLPITELAQRLRDDHGQIAVLDVRSNEEWEGGHIANAIHQVGGEIVQGASAPIDGAEKVAVICGSGYRSSVVASVLLARGHDQVRNVPGGMAAWKARGLPVVTT